VEMQEWLHGRCRRTSGDAWAATWQRRPACGLEQRSNQAELDVHLPPSLFLSPCLPPPLFLSLAHTRGKSLEREISRTKSSIRPGRFPPFCFWCGRAVDSLGATVILALLPCEFASGVCGKALGVRRTPFLA